MPSHEKSPILMNTAFIREDSGKNNTSLARLTPEFNVGVQWVAAVYDTGLFIVFKATPHYICILLFSKPENKHYTFMLI